MDSKAVVAEEGQPQVALSPSASPSNKEARRLLHCQTIFEVCSIDWWQLLILW